MKDLGENLVEEKKITKLTFALFTGLFLIMITAIYSYFIVLQKSFIWEGDGFSQHYLIFKDYLSLIKTYFSNPSAGLQFWDWTNGMGADILSAYGYYVVGDPFVYLGLLFPANMTEFAYHVLVFLRVYAIGIAFLFYCRRMQLASSGALVGTLMYTFAFYVVLNVTRHPFFLMPMLFFPLLCIGIEKILHNESNTLFIVVIFLSACSNFYFFYMLSVLIFIYAVIRYFNLYSTKNNKLLLAYVWKAVYSYLIGLLLSSILFVPIVGGFLQSSREPGNFASGLLVYPVKYYWSLLLNLFISERYLWTVFGYSSFALLMVPMLWMQRKKFSFIPATLGLFAVMLTLPAFGSIMNGFAGPYNRWTFAIPLFVSLGAAILYNSRFNLKKKEILAMGCMILLYGGIIVVVIQVIDFRAAYIAPLIFASLMWLVLFLANEQRNKKVLTKRSKGFYSAVLLLLIMANLGYNAMDYYYSWGQNTIELSVDYGTIDDDYLTTFDRLEQQLPEDTDISRIGVTSKDNHLKNQFIILEEMGLNSYLSVSNGFISNFARQLGTGQFQLIQPLRNGFDDRQIANNFLGVRYILTEKENEIYLPYGYEVVENLSDKSSDFIVAETKNYFPFASANSTYLTYESFEKMNPIEKEQFLSYGVVIDSKEVETTDLTLFNQSLNVKSVGYQLISENKSKADIEEDEITIKEDNGKVELLLDDATVLQQAEVYVYLEGVDFTPSVSDPFTGTPTAFNARIELGERKKTIRQSDVLSFSSYFKRENMLFNMGFQDENSKKETISLQFSKAGNYKLEDLTVFVVPLDKDYSDRVMEKRDNQLNIETFTNQMISGSITMTESSILATTIPFTQGWKAEVNGEKVDTILVNEGFIGLPLESGTSEVTFTYQPPFLILGAFLSLAGIILLALNHVFWNKH